MGGVVTQMATSSGIVREAYSVPSHKDSGKTLPIPARRISFIHPGYDDPGNVLLTLPALDPGGGIHYATAKIACGIIAANRWDGYFTTDKAGENKVESSPETVLLGQSYYFHLPNLTGKQTT
jgi:hypothetical protein